MDRLQRAALALGATIGIVAALFLFFIAYNLYQPALTSRMDTLLGLATVGLFYSYFWAGGCFVIAGLKLWMLCLQER